MTDITRALEQLSPSQRALLDLLLQEQQSARPHAAAPALVRRESNEPAPASFPQQRLWVLHELDPSSMAAYNVHVSVEFFGRLDRALLTRCVNEVVRRHESLRTTLRSHGGDPVQVVAPSLELTLPEEDLSALSLEAQGEEVRRRIIAEANFEFDLTAGPLLRVGVLRLDAQHALVLLTLHHSVTDQWSLGVFLQELMALYKAFEEGLPSPLPELQLQYPDYARWQREQLETRELAGQLDYWRRQLTPHPPALVVPCDHPRPALKTYRGGWHHFRLEPDLARKLKQLAQKEGATLFMVLMAAYQTLLHRYSGQQDFAVGSPVANRKSPELEPLIGFFVNMLVMRADAAGDPTFRSFLHRVRQVCLDAYSHQDVPFDKLVEELQPPRDPSRNPFFEAVFVLQNVPQPALRIPGLLARYVELDLGASQFDLLMELREDRPDRFIGRIEYCADLFDAKAVERMERHYVRLLESVVENADQRLSELPLLRTEERQQLLADGNATSTTFPRETPVHALFSEQAARTPESVALVSGERIVTYAELECRANQLAHHLRAHGVTRGTRVGLCLERSPDLVVGLLAILKAGGAYVPIDHHYPAERISLLLQEADIGVLVTAQPLAEGLPDSDSKRVCVDTDADLIADLPGDAPPSVDVGSDDLAYVMFTSGSTGRPKGVCIPHRAVARLVLANPFIHFGPDEVFLQLAPVAFDASTLELWGALLHGARLVLAPPHSPSLDELAALLTHHRVSTLWLTAALFEQMVIHQGTALAGVRQVLAGGDVLPPLRVRQHLERIPSGAILVNGYGPTENTTFSATHTLRAGEAFGTSVPIGKPLGHSSAFVLDSRLEPVPVGVPGELFVGGDGLAWGYLHRPELTAEKFLPHPFSSAPGARLYRTGDRVRWKPDGTLEFLGRSDFQVKVRGFRIELGEIEAVLQQAPGVQEAVVLAREDAPGDKRLVAYVVPSAPALSAEQSANVLSAIRTYLKTRLPEYMLPAVFMPLDALPLSPNGKVDRKALPAPDVNLARAGTPFEGPRNASEQTLADIWAEVLGLRQVGIDDSFFELGGDSIRSIQVIAKLRERGLELPTLELLQHPTIRELAGVVKATGKPSSLQVEPFSLVSETDRQRLPSDVEDAYPLAALQSGMLFESALDASAGIYHDMFSFHVEMALNESLLHQSFRELFARHAILRTSFHLEGFEEPLQWVHRDVALPLRFEDLRHLETAQQTAYLQAWAEKERIQPFTWNKAPLMRLCVHRRSETTAQLTIVFHHAILDGWSAATLLSELFGRYLQLLEGSTAPAAPSPAASYRQFVALERDAQNSPESERYWLNRMEGVDSASPRPKRARDDERVLHTHEVRIPAALQQALLRVAHEAGVSLKTVLLAVHLRVRGFVEGSSSVVTGIVTNGRPEVIDGERMIGLFLNSVPFPVTLRGGTWLELIQQVAKHEQELMPHRRYPMARLQHKRGGQPLFDTLFNFIHFHIAGGLSQQKGLRFVDEMLGAAWMELPLGVTFTQDPYSSALSVSIATTGTRHEAERSQELGHYYLRALEAVASEPQGRYERAALLPEVQRTTLLETWNATRREVAWDGCLHERFEDRAELTPDALAAIDDEHALTYAELNRRANQLAWALRARGVGPEVRVGLCMERSVDSVVAILAILKAGGAYVPMDPAYPAQRLAYMVGDSQVGWVLTQRRIADKLTGHEVEILCVDDAGDMSDSRGALNPPRLSEPGHLAYVIYTSGSTGKPKGVMVQHGSMMNLRAALAATAYAGVDRPLRVSLNASLSFDASVQQLVQLADGHALCVVSQATREDTRQMMAWLERHEVDVLDCAPSQLRLLLDEGLAAHRPLRVLAGGEALDAALWARLSAHPNIECFNVYGPTECTVDSTVRTVRGAPLPPSLGGPLANARTYVLDAFLQPVPVGVQGELYIGGAGLARGYLNRPELTAERFIPDPFSTVPGARLYRTGDRARWLPQGELEFLGRIDFQVKLRGFRIELGEIESALRQHPTVRDTVVLVREDTPGLQRLVAYVVTEAEATTSVDGSTFRPFLKERLPEHMVPSAFVTLEALPLTPNGKLDRKALPAPEAPRHAATRPLRTDTERRVAAHWATLLHVETVNAEDDFFALGGHSLLATQLVARLRQEFEVDLPLRALFEQSTVEALAARLDVERARGTAGTLPPLRAAPRERPLPQSFVQQRLWVMEQLTPDTATYNNPAAVAIDGALDAHAMEQALRRVVQRHEALRTTFRNEGDQPVQVVHPHFPLELPITDLSTEPEGERDARALQLANEEAHVPFNLVRGPLFRARLLRLAADRHVLLVTMHHIVSDGWSVGVLVREVAEGYEAAVQGRAPHFPSLPVQYADYALWQREWMQGPVLESRLGYWREQLAGAPAALELPTDRPRPAVQTYRGALLPVSLPAALSEAVTTVARRHEATPFMVLLATWQVLLSRYSGQQDISVGSPIAGRTRPELEGLIGFFVNTLVFRARMSPELTFRELLAQVKVSTLGAFEHQDVPFEKLVDVLQPARDPSRSPLFQVTFTLQNTPPVRLELPGLSLQVLETELETVKFDLSLLLEESPKGFSGALNYNTDLFDAATAERMMGHFRTLLESVVANADQRLAELPLLRAEERQQLLVDWNATSTTFPRETPIHALFSAQAARTPEAVALVSGERVVSYAELERRANQLARHLRAYGVTRGTRVGLCLERSPELVVGLLAILKAGGAYVPIDHHYPTERISLLLQEAGVSVFVTQESIADELPIAGGLMVCVDADADLITALPHDAPPSVDMCGDDLAYVMFTSGSTGRPKGVCIPHRAVARLVLSNPFIHFGPDEVFLQLAPVAFDASTLELWGALLHGARLVLAPPHTPSLDELAALLTHHRVSTLWLTAALFEQMVLHQGPALASVRQVLAGGDVLSPLRVRQHLEHIPLGALLVNGYGPTENTTFSATHPLRAGDAFATSVPIGKPLAHSSAFVLDSRLEPVPVGVPGELFVGGDGLAWGYLHRPELTAEKFLPHPFSSSPGARLYRTGDRVRWKPDGSLEFLGRSDFQVKVRGFRIELGEIEAALQQAPGVLEAVVLAREDSPGDKRLVAYVVGEDGVDSVDPRALRDHILRKLPEYLVPAFVIPMEALPLSPNGKVDRKALPAPDAERARTGEAFEAPRDASEQAIADIWAEVLGLSQVGIDDSFFELGGDSIRSIQIIAKLRERGLELPILELLQHPTIRQLSAVVKHTGGPASAQDVAPFGLLSDADRERLPADVEDAYPLAALQSGMLFESALDASAGIYHDMFSFHLELELHEPRLRQALQELMARHPLLRTSFHLDGYDEPLQLVHREVAPPLRIEDLRHLEPSQQDAFLREWVEAERLKPFEWTQAPLLRIAVHRRTARGLQLTIVFHHAILDGWSAATLFSELFGRYLELMEDRHAAPPPSLAASYRQFIALERAAQRSTESERYWLDRMEGVDAASPRPHRARDEERVLHTHGVQIPASLQQALLRVAHEAGVSLKTVLLAVHLRVRAFVEGNTSVVTGIVTNGRPEVVDGERMIGLFLNSVPFPLTLHGGSWLELIQQVAKHEQELIPHRRFPMARLQQKRGGQPLFDTLFNFIHFHVAGGLSQQKGLRFVDEMLGAAWMELPLGVTFTQDPDTSSLSVSIATTGTRHEAEQTRQLGHYYLRALEAVTAAPRGRYEQAALLPEAERATVLAAWNDTRREVAWEGCLHERFEDRATLTPDALAVLDEERSLSYAELNRRANLLAWALRARGVGPEARVGLCMERSVDTVVSILAILKAGGAYVPMDPAYPAQRLAYMVGDSQVRWLLTQRRIAVKLAGHEVETLCVEDAGDMSDSRGASNPPRRSQPEHLAYVIYTSGSTGKPKGVMVQHASVMNLRAALAATAYASVDRPLRVSLNASLSFDASVQQLVQLADGHALCVVPQGAREDARVMLAWLERHEVDVLDCAPSLLRVLLDEGLAARRPLRVLAGGEALDDALWARLSAHPNIECFNVYGPTECTVDSTLRAVRGAPLPPSLGGPLANARTYVLDAYLQPVPVGVPGELYIGGAGLARGYLNRPELTAERFIPNPFSTAPGARLYRTGDRARWLPQGELEFLGRTDFQVKLRGFRIELGEIESALRQHPSVRDTVVLVREDTTGSQRLVAYVVMEAESSKEVDGNALRPFLKERLPEHMVPSAYVSLGALPLNTSGKVDRKALPAPEDSATRQVAYLPPRDALELEVAQLFEELLGVSPIGVTGDFFELGGHSLLAVRLVSMLRSRTGRDLPVTALLQAPTVEGLAAFLRREPAAWTPLVPIQRGGSRVPFFCVHPVGGTVFCYVELARRLGPEQPFYGLQAQGLEGTLPPNGSIESMAASYVAAIRAVQPQGPYRLGGWSLGAVIAFEMARLLQRMGETVDVLALIEPSATSQARGSATSDDLAAATMFALDLARTAGIAPSALPEDAELDATALLERVLREGREAGALIPGAGLEHVHALLRVFTSNLRALQQHTPGTFPGALTVLRGSHTELESSAPEDRGWGRHAARLSVRVVEGDHYSVLRAPGVEALASALTDILAHADTPPAD
ncbi:amino acid adenylation domain-containing protein [Corallococcus macrosporus]|uniref:Non-ribosomal peptide synthetase n=1 Tax=Corallococcus macrosporus DSM 14697 TaxID=1189310 RepID=A0A250JVN3_9BACT|nr:non-ribosomal peptide synthetase [Corallococcus macrosporus]ATB47924.1 non-ribosomal peptide synthetase [Corallococcus macrosporus DSM 14697]